MKLPRSVQIGPHLYRVRRTPKLDQALVTAEDDHGTCSFVAQEICLRHGLAASASAEILLHEVLHGIYKSANLLEAEEERVIAIVAPILLGVLRDNPKLVTFLLDAV